MSLETARDLSIQDLFRVLNEKLSLECTRIQDIPPSRAAPTAHLESEVSTRQPILTRQRRGLTPVGCVDRRPRNQSTRYSEVHPIFAEHVTANQWVAA